MRGGGTDFPSEPPMVHRGNPGQVRMEWGRRGAAGPGGLPRERGGRVKWFRGESVGIEQRVDGAQTLFPSVCPDAGPPAGRGPLSAVIAA